jgi:hypothetical protein
MKQEITKERAYRYRIMTLTMFNFLFGASIFAYLTLLQDYITYNLWFNITSMFGVGFPSIVSFSLVTIIMSILWLMVSVLDYKIYYFGLESLKIKGELIS